MLCLPWDPSRAPRATLAAKGLDCNHCRSGRTPEEMVRHAGGMPIDRASELKEINVLASASGIGIKEP
jgi:hypothetical protein